MKNIRYFIEFVALLPVMGLFAALPPAAASHLGGWIGRAIGPRMGASKKALANLRLALPGRDDSEYAAIITGMWDNLGRTMAEYPHLEKICRTTTVIGAQHLAPYIEADKPLVLFSGHLANWEAIIPNLLANGINAVPIVRSPNNPWVDRLLARFRRMGRGITVLHKSRTGTRHLLQTLKDGTSVAILIDQKYNEGIAAPFFGHPAMTSPAFVTLAQRYDAPLIPVRIERVNGVNFRLTILPPLPAFETDGTTPRAIESVIADAHKLLEQWIAETPAQWLWLHRRWSERARTLYHQGTESIN